MKNISIKINIPESLIKKLSRLVDTHAVYLLIFVLGAISIYQFIFYLNNGLGVAYNDARSHLDIGRRVVEGLKPGLAQLGSVWLPLPHLLMVPTIWNDFMWHTGLSGALQSMISYVATGLLIFTYLRKLKVSLLGSYIAVLVFALNINILYLQSTAMTELLLLATMTAGAYFLVMWHKTDRMLDLIWASIWIMLSTLIRYDGYFLLFLGTLLVAFHAFRKKGFKASEGTTFFFLTIAALGIVMWLLWNLLIFKDPLYFAFGPYSAHAQQEQLDQAGILATKHNIFLSLKIYLYALSYNSYLVIPVLALIGVVVFLRDKSLSFAIRLSSMALLAPLFFNILALYLGHSVLFVQGISGNTWFNVRYGIMMMPSIAIFIGYLISKSKKVGYLIAGVVLITTFISFDSFDAVTIDDARVGSSQKNVSEVSDWLAKNASDKDGFVLISAASHDAIIFSSGLPMKKFIHEGTGAYWISATGSPDRWARWIVMRTNDNNDSTFRLIKDKSGFKRYNMVRSFPFADIYELKDEYLSDLQTKPVFINQK